MTSGRPQNRRIDGERTHAAILDAATRLASVEGIYGLSIGRLADELGVSKSGLYAHFGSKEQLQRETIEAAQVILEREVMVPAYEAPEGIKRLELLAESYFSYLERWVFPGGCFFASLLAEVDARSGPIREQVVALERGWLQELGALTRTAQRLGQVHGDVDADQVAFEIDACFELANYHYVLFRDPAVLARGREAVRAILDRVKRP